MATKKKSKATVSAKKPVKKSAKTPAKKSAKAPIKKTSKRGPMAVTARATMNSSTSNVGFDFGAPVLPMPSGPVYPPRDYEEAATLTVTAWRETAHLLPELSLNPDSMAEMLGYAGVLQGAEEHLTRLLAKAGGSRVAYDDKIWRVCLKLNTLARELGDDHPELQERFAFLAEFIKARAGKGNSKKPPVTAVEPA